MTLNYKLLAESYREAMLTDLFELLRIPSIRENDKASEEAPFGPGPRAALDKMISFGERDGFRSKNVDNVAGCIYVGSGDESVGILVHLDVVPATGLWQNPPFEPLIREGKLYARGASDNKGPAMSAYYAIRLLVDAGISFNREVRFIFGTDEESNWECLSRFFEKEPYPTMGFSPDADFPIINGEKGMVDLRLVSESKTPVHSDAPLYLNEFKGGSRSNMVPESAQAILIGDEKSLHACAEEWRTFLKDTPVSGKAHLTKGELHMLCHGKSAHGAEPEAGHNAATWLASFLAKEPLNPQAARWCKWIDEHLHLAADGRNLGIATHDDIMGDVTVNAGIFHFQEGKGTIITNNRYPRSTDKKAILKGYQENLSDSDITIDAILTDKPVHYIPADDPLVVTLLDVYHRQTALPAYATSIGGGTYARMIPRGVAFGPQFPDTESTMHQADEYAVVDDLIQAIAIYAEAIYELTR